MKEINRWRTQIAKSADKRKIETQRSRKKREEKRREGRRRRELGKGWGSSGKWVVNLECANWMCGKYGRTSPFFTRVCIYTFHSVGPLCSEVLSNPYRSILTSFILDILIVFPRDYQSLIFISFYKVIFSFHFTSLHFLFLFLVTYVSIPSGQQLHAISTTCIVVHTDIYTN